MRDFSSIVLEINEFLTDDWHTNWKFSLMIVVAVRKITDFKSLGQARTNVTLHGGGKMKIFLKTPFYLV